ncbi:hypothetical protein RSSM_03635 [Rhodopirellula sallentina SM41]|uniref:Uncharacterized protein n=1 Tax=Rhodopirellula sallentina SM41 TaxID=1263870 RepID=M5UAR2_9BACT|nr:hypothetical protein RSSM_03635 [Rhodopirellula sallentina SM41]
MNSRRLVAMRGLVGSVLVVGLFIESRGRLIAFRAIGVCCRSDEITGANARRLKDCEIWRGGFLYWIWQSSGH